MQGRKVRKPAATSRGARHQVARTRETKYLQGVGGSVPRASRGGGARARADSVGTPASEDPRQVLDGVGVHRDGPRLHYFPKVSKEREVRKQRALQ